MRLLKLLFLPFRKLLAVVIIIALLLFGIDWLYGFVMLKLYPKDYSEYVETYCEEYGVDPDFAYAFIKCESNFKRDAKSDAGAIGLMQLTPQTFSYISEKVTGEEIDPDRISEAELNIRFGIWYISHLSKKFWGDKSLIIAAYNAGPGRVNSWLQNEEYSSDGKSLSAYPYEETERHVKKVLAAEKKYKELYKEQ